MIASATGSKELVQQYVDALSGKPKTPDTIHRFVTDPVLADHIATTEAAFPSYRIDVDQLISEGDTVALRGTFSGTHERDFAGIPATGRQVSAGLMIFYRIADNRIVQHWMQLDTASLFQQLNGPA